MSGRLVMVLFAFFVCYSLVIQDLRYAFVPAGAAIVGLSIGGFVVFRRISGAFAIPWPAAESEEVDEALTISGVRLPFLSSEQDLIIEYHTRRILELTAVCVLSVGALAAIVSGMASAEPLIHGANLFVLEILCLAGAGFLLFSFRWFRERHFLPRSHVVLGEVLGRDPGFLRTGISYQFFDDHRQRRGGRGPFSEADNAVLVFYDPEDPDRNLAHSAFLFHRFRLTLVPKHRLEKTCG